MNLLPHPIRLPNNRPHNELFPDTYDCRPVLSISLLGSVRLPYQVRHGARKRQSSTAAFRRQSA